MKIVDVDKLTPLLESIKKAIYFEDAGATRNRILSCLSDIAALATDNPWEAAARKLAENIRAGYDDCCDMPCYNGKDCDENGCTVEKLLAWAKGETK